MMADHYSRDRLVAPCFQLFPPLRLVSCTSDLRFFQDGMITDRYPLDLFVFSRPLLHAKNILA